MTLDPLRPLPMSPEEIAALVERTRERSAAALLRTRSFGGRSPNGKGRFVTPIVAGESPRARKTRIDREARQRAREHRARQALRWENP